MERKEKILEGVQRKYIKWSLNFLPCTPDYIVYKETGVEKFSSAAGCKAIGFEEKALKDGERKLLIECIREKEREGSKAEGSEERELFVRRNGFASERVKILREKGINVARVLRKREREEGAMDGRKNKSF